MKVLLVEDDHFSQLVAETALRNIGAAFTSVESGEAALAELGLRGPDYDFVLMDFRMPGLDGFATTRKIREHIDPQIRELPVIGLSGSKSFEDQREAISAGMNLCVSKPVSALMLKRVLVEQADVDLEHAALEPSGVESKVPLVLDIRTLNYLAEETDVEVVKKVVQSFLKNLPNYIDQINQGLAQERDDIIHRYAHILKSSSGTVGAAALFALASDLEDLSSREHQGSLYDLVIRTRQASEAAVVELTTYLDELLDGEVVVSR